MISRRKDLSDSMGRRAAGLCVLACMTAAACAAPLDSEIADRDDVNVRAEALTDRGYGDLPLMHEDVNRDGRWDYCRFVGNRGELFFSCALQDQDGTFHDDDQYAYNSVKGFDLGYADEPRMFEDVDGDGRREYCRIVGDRPNTFLSCNLARDDGFDKNQYTFNSPHTQHEAIPGGFYDINGDSRPDFCQFEGRTGDEVWTRCCNTNLGDRFSRPECIKTDAMGRPIDPPQINQPVNATCVCTVNPDVVLRQSKRLCFARGEDTALMAASAAEQCTAACARVANSNWETDEALEAHIEGFDVASGDCVQSFDTATFEF